MHIRILGSAAGGGFPQWNCNCRNCRRLREGTPGLEARTQSSIAVSADGEHWLLCNASPDIRAQLAAFPDIQPGRQPRDTGISAVLLIDAQIDHSSGLLMLREGCPLDVYATAEVHQDLSTGFPLFEMLRHWQGGLRHRPLLPNGDTFHIPELAGLSFAAIPLASKPPPYSPRRQSPAEGDNIGLFVRDQRSGRALFYAPGLGSWEPHLDTWVAAADCLLVDGTLWRDDEMPQQNLGEQTGRAMGHLPQSGPGGMLEQLARWPHKRRVLIHINNSNPILDARSEERAQVEASGIEVARDGLEIRL